MTSILDQQQSLISATRSHRCGGTLLSGPSQVYCDRCHMAVEHNDLVLCRSDHGDGGWSLHAPGSTSADIASGDAPYLISGDAVMADGYWSRPDDDDYLEAAWRAINRDAEIIRAAQSALDGWDDEHAADEEITAVFAAIYERVPEDDEDAVSLIYAANPALDADEALRVLKVLG